MSCLIFNKIKIFESFYRKIIRIFYKSKIFYFLLPHSLFISQFLRYTPQYPHNINFIGQQLSLRQADFQVNYFTCFYSDFTTITLALNGEIFTRSLFASFTFLTPTALFCPGVLYAISSDPESTYISASWDTVYLFP